MKYDLEERVEKFGEDIIEFLKSVRKTTITRPIINQLVKSGTVIGANYMEVNGGSSKKDFRNKIFIARKEANESRHWLRMIAKAAPKSKDEAKLLWHEANELTLIFSKISRTVSS